MLNNLIQKAKELAQPLMDRVETEIKIKQLVSELAKKQTAAERAKIAKQLADLVNAIKPLFKKGN